MTEAPAEQATASARSPWLLLGWFAIPAVVLVVPYLLFATWVQFELDAAGVIAQSPVADAGEEDVGLFLGLAPALFVLAATLFVTLVTFPRGAGRVLWTGMLLIAVALPAAAIAWLLIAGA
ncbi:hypothetical protein P5G50_16380 [Leifsonia sp. F6_8S_P_1B]|uniref:ABC transporter permease n=1 Tax=Leifsonia williamsii TaxID=3035919 RepID=A0ABT8KF32_9MICO|nr:hypothetical protein [Leifsonia williamsii]MDN4616029.1 hypothetical protein [Leifsonia williamsii]